MRSSHKTLPFTYCIFHCRDASARRAAIARAKHARASLQHRDQFLAQIIVRNLMPRPTITFPARQEQAPVNVRSLGAVLHVSPSRSVVRVMLKTLRSARLGLASRIRAVTCGIVRILHTTPRTRPRRSSRNDRRRYLRATTGHGKSKIAEPNCPRRRPTD